MDTQEFLNELNELNTGNLITHEYLHYHNKYEKLYGKDNTIVCMRVGDFFEFYQTLFFGPNLDKISEVTNLQKTKKYKQKDASFANPYMSGFHCVSLDKFVKMLIDNNYTVIVVDQVSPPPKPKRDVVGIYSPGTYIDTNIVYSNYTLCMYIEHETQPNSPPLMCIGLSTINVSTGICSVYETYSNANDEKYAIDEAYRFIANYDPKEVIIIGSLDNKTTLLSYLELEHKKIHHISKCNNTFNKISYQNEFFGKIYKDTNMLSPIENLDMEKMPYARISFITLLDFISGHDKTFINHINKPDIFLNSKHLILGNDCIKQLNILENNTSPIHNTKIKCLLDVINMATTNMGKRFMKYSITNPLNDIDEINLRYDCAEELINTKCNYDNILKYICDIQKFNRKIVSGNIGPINFCEVVESYKFVKHLYEQVAKTNLNKKFLPNDTNIKETDDFIKNCEKIFDFEELKKYHNINDIETSIFNPNLYTDIDNLVDIVKNDGMKMEDIGNCLATYIDNITKSKTNTKVILKRNKKLGHYLCLTKMKADMLKIALKDTQIIKINDTLTIEKNKLYFDEVALTTTKIYFQDVNINSKNNNITNEKLKTLVKRKYNEILINYGNIYSNMFNAACLFVSKIDFINSNAKLAQIYNYCKPKITIDNTNVGYIKATKLRHPIAERINTDTSYVSHNINLGIGDKSNMLLFGLNSSGKSTLMKAVALSIIMAQSGLYVPCENYEYSLYDHIFVRITTNDDMYKNFSSFSYEMTELSAILKRCGQKTAVFGDEICTNTEYDSGLAIVASTIIKLSQSGSTFMFASHLHALTKLQKIMDIKNLGIYHLTVKYDNVNDVLIFDRILCDGNGESNYGLLVLKYIIKDDDFMKLAYSIRDDIGLSNDNILPTKTSKYNSKVYMDECGVCKKKNPTIGESILDTHHIDFQCSCDGNDFVPSKTKKRNDKSNLIVLCKPCHRKVHSKEIIINEYKNTSKGRTLSYEIVG